MRYIAKINIVLLTFFGVAVVAGLWLFTAPSSEKFATDNASFDTSSFSDYVEGEVVEVISEDVSNSQHNRSLQQQLRVRINSGPDRGREAITDFTKILDASSGAMLTKGDRVVLGKLVPTDQEKLLFGDSSGEYVVVDRYRFRGIILAVAVFVILAVVVGKKKGLYSLAGLVITAAVLLIFSAPQLMQGKNPVLVALASSVMISISTMLIAHGNNIRSKLSILSTLASLLVAFLVSYIFVRAGQLFGLGQSDAFVLQSGLLGAIDLRGLLLGGLMISLLGILDDVTTTQTASVEEIHNANPNLNFSSVYRAGMSVGREHIASLINTLILVYVGSSLPLFLLLVSATKQPLWVLINSEFIAEEIIRALSGSTALILAVPISTYLASLYFCRSRHGRDMET